jgi:membrane-bound lytic murein transglycosylase B
MFICTRIVLFLLLIVSSSLSLSKENNFLDSDRAQNFIQMMVKEHKFKKSYLEKLLSQATHQQSVIDKISNSAEGGRLTWKQYRDMMVSKKRIINGRKVLKKYKKQLHKLYLRYGVNPKIIVALFGIETFYGKHKGKYLVIDALSTLSFDFKPRERFFTKELQNFLLFTRKNKLDPMKLKGSYAGAMGMPQFMPSSYMSYARSYIKNQAPDIWTNELDAFASIAYYLKRYGWKNKLPITFRAHTTKHPVKISVNNLKLNYTYKQIRAKGWRTNDKLIFKAKKLMPVEFKYNNKTRRWLGSKNLYVISRYNHSIYYAMSANILASKF